MKTVQTKLMEHAYWQVWHVVEKCITAYLEKDNYLT